MEDAFLIVITLCAAFYLYKKMFKSGGCNCGNNKEKGSCTKK